jgi:hypothetical protein
MKNVSENELLSAYLDGELTATEQADVEQLLDESPEARRLLEELRALSSSLRSLPQYKLDEDLSEGVLRLAERRILAGDGRRGQDAPVSESAPPAKMAPAAGPAPRDHSRPAAWHRIVTPRNFIYAAATAAAAVLLFVLTNDGRQPEFDEIARVSDEETERKKSGDKTSDEDRPEGKELDGSGKELHRFKKELGKSMAARMPSRDDDEFSVPSETFAKKQDVKLAEEERRTGHDRLPKSSTGPLADRYKAKDKETPAMDEKDNLQALEEGVMRPSEGPSIRDFGPSKEQKNEGLKKTKTAPTRETRPETAMKIDSGGAPAGPVLGDPADESWEDNALVVPQRDGKAGKPDRPRPAQRPPAEPGALDLAGPEKTRGAGIGPAAVPPPAAPGAAPLIAPEVAAPEGMLVVQCQISPNVLASKEFERVLTNSGIVEQKRYQRQAEPSSRRKLSLGKRREEAERVSAEKAAAVAFGTGVKQLAHQLVYVEVEATPAQIHSALQQLRARPEFSIVKTAQIPTAKRPAGSRFAQNARLPEPSLPQAEPAKEGREGVIGRRRTRREEKVSGRADPARLGQQGALAGEDMPSRPGLLREGIANRPGILRGRKERLAAEARLAESIAEPAVGQGGAFGGRAIEPTSYRALFVLRVVAPPTEAIASEAAETARDVGGKQAKPASAAPPAPAAKSQ